MTNYPITAEALDLEIYHLSCFFAASRELIDLSKTYGSLKSLINTFELAEVSKKIISIAVTLRSSLDCIAPKSKLKEVSKNKTGILVKDIKEGIEQTLEFREACNKIIHATDIEFFNNSNPDNGLEWSLSLFGNYQGKQWKASLDVLKFIDNAHKLT
jgi:hypothetical protein